MSQHLEFNSSFYVKADAWNNIGEEIKKRFDAYKSSFGMPAVTVLDKKKMMLNMGFDDKISGDGIDEIAVVWEKFVKEYADFSKGVVLCNRHTDGGTVEWMIGPADKCAFSEEQSIKLQITTLQLRLKELKKSKLYKAKKIVTTRDTIDGAEIK